jgi:hypothetical protein
MVREEDFSRKGSVHRSTSIDPAREKGRWLEMPADFWIITQRRILSMKNSGVCIVLLLVAFAVGCATVVTEMTYDYDRGVNFASLQTYDWVPGRPTSTEYELALKRFEHEVDAQLQAKGFRKDPGNPDFVIAIHGSKQTKISHYQSSSRHYSEPMTYEEGTVGLDFLDAKTNDPIWRASAVGVLGLDQSPEQKDKDVNKIVTEMLQNFPPSP